MLDRRMIRGMLLLFLGFLCAGSCVKCLVGVAIWVIAVRINALQALFALRSLKSAMQVLQGYFAIASVLFDMRVGQRCDAE